MPVQAIEQRSQLGSVRFRIGMLKADIRRGITGTETSASFET
jgi:hypothetical protein